MTALYLLLAFAPILPILLGVVLIIARLRTKWNKSPVCLAGKTVIVTGANSGIGFSTAFEFAIRGAKVILACRSIPLAEKARKKIVEDTQNPNVFVRIVDLASLKSVRAFAAEINNSEDRLDILVNNAGAIMEGGRTVDGLSKNLQVNSLGPFLLTLLLIDLLKRTKSSRIVNVGSTSIHYAKLNINDLNYFSPSIFARVSMFNYANSKLCSVILTNELARRLKSSGVTVNTVDPCLVYTGIAREWNILGKIMCVCVKLLLRSSREGAQGSIYVAISKNLDNVTGKFFMNSVETSVPSIVNNQKIAKELWENCLSFLQVTDEERLSIPCIEK
ncbi:retinol dehydrogenase 12-like [Photinus pyralis]|uniref:retinol dehydrogenase 12-like n=1 Tax=Photinus pyralis TaxID=7054 RepID=UPI0012678336|nr:retinol dehydrogenase 12-like [Photinus pyralis]